MTFSTLVLAVLAQTAPATAASPNLPTPENYTPAAPPNISSVATPGWVPLFNGVNFDNLYTFRQRDGKNNDVDHIFKVDNGTIHALDVDDPSVSQPNGYLGTNEEFRNVHIRLEYQWGAKKLAVPRHPEGLPRDAGLLYLTTGPDFVWPMCIECQIQERDTGDIWLLPNGAPCPIANTTVVSVTPEQRGVYTFQPGGAPYQVPVATTNHRLYHSAAYDQLSGWNTVEVYITENNAVHVVNGHVNNYLADIRLPTGEPLVQGRILLQQESNEVFYRNVSVQPLFATASGNPPYKILVFSKTTPPPDGFRHASIPDGVAAVKKLGEQNGFTADATEDATAFTDDNLKQYKAIVFMSTSGNFFNDAQKQAMQNYIKAGGGFVGVHSATAGEYRWEWYGQLVGAFFAGHPSGTPTGTVKIEDFSHPSTSSLPSTWTRTDEWYNFRPNPRENVHVLATLDETSYQGGTMNGDHPVIWYHEFDGGRSWYTALGHTKESYTDPLFLMSLLGGIKYAAGTAGLPPKGAIELLNNKSQADIDLSKGNASISFGSSVNETKNGGASAKVTNGRVSTKDLYQDFKLHVEFMIQAKIVSAAPARGMILLQDFYGIKIADSFDRPPGNFDACGALSGLRNPAVNASQPAETWQSFDITFRAAKWQGSNRTANARVTIYQNGVLIHDNVELSQSKPAPDAAESATSGPLVIDCEDGVTLRNIWIKPLSPSSPTGTPAPVATPTTASR